MVSTMVWNVIVPRSGCVTGFAKSAGWAERMIARFQARNAVNVAERQPGITLGIALRPLILIERLNDVVIFGERLL